jgi:hypothetical protein
MAERATITFQLNQITKQAARSAKWSLKDIPTLEGEYYGCLIEEQDWRKWPPNYLDTITWARWVLCERPIPPKEYKEITDRFKFILSSQQSP